MHKLFELHHRSFTFVQKLVTLTIRSTHTILYVQDQDKSTQFYQLLLDRQADLWVPGMTEFRLAGNFVLGLMPYKSITKILADKMPHPESRNGIPGCELYFYVDDLETAFSSAVHCGALLISPIEDREWGDRACYFSDPDGHIIAFAEKIT